MSRRKKRGGISWKLPFASLLSIQKPESREVSRPTRKEESNLPYVGTLGLVASAAYLHRKVKKDLSVYIKTEFERDNPDMVYYDNLIDWSEFSQYDRATFINRSIDRIREYNKMLSGDKSNVYMGGFDIIVMVMVHGNTCTTCGLYSKIVNENVHFLEAVPCGTFNFPHVKIEKDVYEMYLARYQHYPDFLEKIQAAFRRTKVDHLQRSTSSLPGYKEYASNVGWNVIKGRFLERSYEPDKELLNEIRVCYTKTNAFIKGQNLLITNDIKNRSALVDLLKKNGYDKPLIIDMSCAEFEPALPNKSFMVERAQKQGYAGGTRKRNINYLRRRLRNGIHP